MSTPGDLCGECGHARSYHRTSPDADPPGFMICQTPEWTDPKHPDQQFHCFCTEFEEAVRPRRIPLFEVAEIVRNWPTAVGYGPYISWSWGVPLATARRWVYEARRAGLLEPGTTGRPCPACNGTGVTRWQNGTPRPKGRTSERQAS